MAFERLHAGDDDGGGGDNLKAFKWLHAGDDDCGGSDNLMAFERLHAGNETVLTAARLGFVTRTKKIGFSQTAHSRQPILYPMLEEVVVGVLERKNSTRRKGENEEVAGSIVRSGGHIAPQNLQGGSCVSVKLPTLVLALYLRGLGLQLRLVIEH
ncbi:hypothetical protein [Oryza sativa Japonica Group]|uniref:Uncharacterized protein n=1 Tax=Oryza sativa subsp. japonica TaxID=39947 RepID=Q656I3_ORYSJ|nr:hypothetical protein [Oryza sativa Japonica Group]